MPPIDETNVIESITKLGHKFVSLKPFRRVEFVCGSCSQTIICQISAATRQRNTNCCMFCDVFDQHQEEGQDVLGRRGKFLVALCSKDHRYEKLLSDRERGCPLCSSDKRADTNLKKYGAANVFASDQIKAKIVAVNNERFGCNYPMQNKAIKAKMNETNKERCGYAYPINQPWVYEKIQATHTENHGAPFPLQSESIKEKMKANSQARFGTDHPCQNPDELKRRLKLMFRTKDYTFPSGRVDTVMGYEGMCITELLETFSEQQIVTDNTIIPIIKYKDKSNKTRKYLPDIMVLKNEDEFQLIEVKSLYTLMLDFEKNLTKFHACRDQGVNLTVWIYHPKATGKNKEGQRVKQMHTFIHQWSSDGVDILDDDPLSHMVPTTLEAFAALKGTRSPYKELVAQMQMTSALDRLTLRD